MVAIVCTALAAVALITVAALLCFKGITFYKKMEVVPTKIIPPSTRPKEMDEIEKKLNEVDRLNAQYSNEHIPHDKEPGYAAGSMAMDAALKKIHEVFGPEQDPEEVKKDG